MEHTAALHGIRVLDLGILVQGPQAAAMLADMGADVVKIERPGIGDHSRYIFVSDEDKRSAFFTACNRGKRSVAIDLTTDEGTVALQRLARQSDVVISNFSSGTMDRLGLGYDQLREVNPKLVWAAGNTFGSLGDDAHREGADLAAQCAGGLISTTGQDGAVPTPVGVTIADHIASLNMVCGILAALHARDRTGVGQKVEVSLLGGQIWAQASEYTHYFLTGSNPGRSNFGHPLIGGLYRIFETADGWIGIIGAPGELLDQLLITLDLAELLVNDTTADPKSTVRLEELTTSIAEVLRTRSTNEWCELFRETDIRYAPVRDYSSVVANTGPWDNGYFIGEVGAGGTTQYGVGSPIRLSENPVLPNLATPDIGQHTNEVLREFGFSEDEISVLAEQKIIIAQTTSRRSD